MNWQKRFSRTGIINATLNVERGWVNDPNDSGGETNHGVVKRLALHYKDLWPKYNWNGDMRTMPKALAEEIIDREFWLRMNLTEVATLSPMIADKLFEWGVNAGSVAPVKALQRHLNASNRQGRLWKDIRPDGVLGTNTIRILRTYLNHRGNKGIKWALTQLIAQQSNNYLELVERREKDEEFYSGWMDRVHNVTNEYFEAIDDGWFSR